MEKKQNQQQQPKQQERNQYWCHGCESTITFKAKDFEPKCPICESDCIEELEGDQTQIKNFEPPTRQIQSKLKRHPAAQDHEQQHLHTVLRWKRPEPRHHLPEPLRQSEQPVPAYYNLCLQESGVS